MMDNPRDRKHEKNELCAWGVGGSVIPVGVGDVEFGFPIRRCHVNDDDGPTSD